MRFRSNEFGRFGSFVAWLVLVSWLGVASSSAQAGETKKPGKVRLTKTDKHTVDVKIDGKLFTTFQYADSLPKPFFWPVHAADGTLLSRPLIGTGGGQSQDHKHHKGIWLSVDEVNEIDFWAEHSKIQNQSVEITTNNQDVAVLHVVNHWLNTAGKPVMTETTRYAISGDRLVTCDVTFTASHGPVHFGDTKEGLFGFRMVDGLREKEGGKVINSAGKTGTKACWGQAANWVDYSGEIDGSTYGITLFDHPQNFRPSRYHVRDYGLFSVSPFGEKAYAKQDANEKQLAKGESLRLRYGMLFHNGNHKAADVAGAYKSWVQSEK